MLLLALRSGASFHYVSTIGILGGARLEKVA
jgi:hypothetical protein